MSNKEKNWSVILIDLTNITDVKDLELLIEDNGFDNIDAIKLMDHKKKGYRKLFFDKQTQATLAYTHINSSDKIIIQDNFQDFLKKLKPIDFTKDVKDISIDSILDKINESGIQSLSKREKQFLDENSREV